MKNGIMVSGNLKRLGGDTDGSVLLEFTIFVAAFFTILFGIVEFSLAYYQWNAATKAVQLGARLAAVSGPIASELVQATWEFDDDEYVPGDLVAIAHGFTIVCTGAGGGNCNGEAGDYDADAMNTIVFGRGNTSCDGAPPNIGMCNMFARVTPENVRVTYSYTGMGYAGRPGGPVPTIRVELVGIPFQFFFLNGLLGFGTIEIPGLASTMSGEDLSIAGG